MEDTNISNQTSPSEAESVDLMSVFEDREPVQGEQGSTQPEGQTEDQRQKETVSAREWQSRYDKLQNEHQAFRQQFAERDKAYNLLAEAAENPAVARALMNELLPGSVQMQDIDSFVESQLKKEFGDDFEVDEADARKGFGKSFRYLERARKLYAEAEEKSSVQTLAEIKARQKEQKESEARQQEEIRQNLMSKYGADEATVNRFFKFAGSITPEDFFKIFQWTEKQAKRQAPAHISAQQGSGFQGGSKQLQQFINSF